MLERVEWWSDTEGTVEVMGGENAEGFFTLNVSMLPDECGCYSMDYLVEDPNSGDRVKVRGCHVEAIAADGSRFDRRFDSTREAFEWAVGWAAGE